MTNATIHHGDVLAVLRTFKSASFDALLSDPPAGIAFMGKDWDRDKGGRKEWIRWLAKIMREAKRVLKPGAHVLVWALPRTSHWTVTAIEDAGFEIRDVITHHFGSGFPKSLDVSKVIDGALGAERSVIGVQKLTGTARIKGGSGYTVEAAASNYESSDIRDEIPITAAASEEARSFAGYGTALKPASEHWILARKPLAGTVAANVLKHGTGGLAIDACRVGTSETPSADRRETALRTGGAPVGRPEQSTKFNRMAARVSAEVYTAVRPGEALGRWPANLMLSHADGCVRVGERRVAGDTRGDCNGKRPAGFANVGAKSGDAEPSALVYGDEAVETWTCVAGCPVKLLDEQSGDRPGMSGGGVHRADYAGGMFGSIDSAGTARGDSGGASRFFYVAKPSRFERELGCEHLPAKSAGEATDREEESAGLNSPRAGAGRTNGARNFHPTVKAIALTTELAKLIMPPAIVRPRRILCPFAGSGSEVIGAMRAGWDEIHGIELEEEFVTIARARIARWSEAPAHLSVDEIVEAAERGGDKRQEPLFK